MRITKKAEEAVGTSIIHGFGILLAALMIAFFAYLYSGFINNAMAKETSDSFGNFIAQINGDKAEGITPLDEKTPKQVNLNIGGDYVLYGFNINRGELSYYYPVWNFFWRDNIGKVERPMTCPLASACLCICTDDCSKIRDCQVLDGFEKVVAKSDFWGFNKGVVTTAPERYVAFFGRTGVSVGDIGASLWKVRYVKMEKKGDVLYLSEGS